MLNRVASYEYLQLKALLSEFGIVGMGYVQLWLLRPPTQLAFNLKSFSIFIHLEFSHA